MRQRVENFRENHGDTARFVLFQLAAMAGDYFLFCSSKNSSKTKQALNTAYAVTLHGAAYLAARHFDKPKAVEVKQENTPKNPTTTVPSNEALHDDTRESSRTPSPTPNN